MTYFKLNYYYVNSVQYTVYKLYIILQFNVFILTISCLFYQFPPKKEHYFIFQKFFTNVNDPAYYSLKYVLLHTALHAIKLEDRIQ